MVMDVMAMWEQKQHNKASGKKEIPKLTQEQMKEMLAKVKKK